MNIFYRIGKKLFVNITNACPCSCIFCIRNLTDGMNENETLWLDYEPSLDEIKTAFEKRQDLHETEEIVFCGFGEPLERAEDVAELIKYLKKTGIPIRINTNGLVRLINPSFDILKLAEADCISISLNADDADEYFRITQPRFGKHAYDEMLKFAAEMKKYTNVVLSVVKACDEFSLDPNRVENCRKIAEKIGAGFRVR